MPHELILAVEAAPIVALILLLTPKRGLTGLRDRFADLGDGRRRWLFEPGRRREGGAKVLSETLLAFQLGLPLYVAGRLAESRAQQNWLERKSAWAQTPTALLASHLAGAMTESEMHAHVRSRGWPLPSEKAKARKAEPYRLLSLDWWLDVERRARGGAGGYERQRSLERLVKW